VLLVINNRIIFSTITENPVVLHVGNLKTENLPFHIVDSYHTSAAAYQLLAFTSDMVVIANSMHLILVLLLLDDI